MRKGIYERINIMKKESIKVNYSKLAKQYNCDYRTIKRYFELDGNVIRAKVRRPSKLDPFKEIIKDKLALGCSFTAIYRFILEIHHLQKCADVFM